MYRVIKTFTDLMDGCYLYCTGDSYPREGVHIDQERVSELSGYDNKQGQPLIDSVKGKIPIETETMESPKSRRVGVKKEER